MLFVLTEENISFVFMVSVDLQIVPVPVLNPLSTGGSD